MFSKQKFILIKISRDLYKIFSDKRSDTFSEIF